MVNIKRRNATLRQFANGMPEATKRKLSIAHKGLLKLDNNPNWSGDKVGYHGIHAWLKNYYGKADRCDLDSCTSKCLKYEWALKKGFKYERKRRNFLRLCVSCHKKYDLPLVRKVTITRNYFIKGHIPWNKGHGVKK